MQTTSVLLLLTLTISMASAMSMVKRETTERKEIPCPVVSFTDSYFIANSRQCDMFHLCRNGFINGTYLCQDGLVFDGNTCILPQCKYILDTCKTS